jgi:RHS repeat-associated protein
LKIENPNLFPYLPLMQNTPFINPCVGIRSTSDYSGFGVQLDGRTVSSGGYRYGFNGQERIDEIHGEGNYLDFKYRGYDSRIGRFFATDPLKSSYPELTPYQFASNSPIFMIELEGLEGKIAVTTKWYTDKGIEKSKTKYYTVDGLKADLIKICWKPHGDAKGPVVSIDYYGRMEDGTRSGNSLKNINPDAKPTVAELNAFFGSDPNNSFNINTNQKASVAAENAQAAFDNSVGGWIYNNILADGALEGDADPVNIGSLTRTEERVLQIAAATILAIPLTILEISFTPFLGPGIIVDPNSPLNPPRHFSVSGQQDIPE